MQTDRILSIKTTSLRRIISKCIIMQRCFSIEILTLKTQILLNLFFFKLLYLSPRAIGCLPNYFSVAIGQLQWRTDLIRMEVVDFLLFPLRLIHPR
ncbi:hypothetical protein PpSQ1_23965 [Pseudomonas putida]|nr:hypothetical protein PpSQ1_23965 [Pseudomonas putida]